MSNDWNYATPMIEVKELPSFSLSKVDYFTNEDGTKLPIRWDVLSGTVLAVGTRVENQNPTIPFNTFVVQTAGTEPEYNGTNVTFENWTHIGYASGYEQLDLREENSDYNIAVASFDEQENN